MVADYLGELDEVRFIAGQEIVDADIFGLKRQGDVSERSVRLA